MYPGGHGHRVTLKFFAAFKTQMLVRVNSPRIQHALKVNHFTCMCANSVRVYGKTEPAVKKTRTVSAFKWHSCYELWLQISPQGTCKAVVSFS